MYTCLLALRQTPDPWPNGCEYGNRFPPCESTALLTGTIPYGSRITSIASCVHTTTMRRNGTTSPLIPSGRVWLLPPRTGPIAESSGICDCAARGTDGPASIRHSYRNRNEIVTIAVGT